MITIKLPYKSKYNFVDLQRQYSILVKSCYNRLLDKFTDKDIRLYCKTLNNVSDLDSRFVENAILDAKSIQKENKVIFNRFNFIKRFKDKITKEEFKINKYLSLVNYGEKLKKGNRKFYIDLDNNKIVFKLNRNKHIDIFLPELKQNYKKQLTILEELMKESKISVSFRLDNKYIYIFYEEQIKDTNIVLKDNRILGLDLNPNNIGISILDFNNSNDFNIIYKSFIDITNNNKLQKNIKDYNVIMISKQIVNLMKSFNVRNIAIENLNMKPKQHNKGKRYNKLCNNDWNRNLFVNNITKRCKINNMLVYLVHPAYTSIIGNLKYNYFDSTNASIEVARRGYQFNKMFIKNSFYPVFSLKSQWNLWKKDTNLFTNDWKEFYKYLKTLEMKYRVPINNLVYKKECTKRIEFSVF